MILNRNIVAAVSAVAVFGALMANPVFAASKWSDVTAVTNNGHEMTHPESGGKEVFSPGDLSSVTHRGLDGTAKPVGHISSANYGESDLTSVTHRNASDVRHN